VKLLFGYASWVRWQPKRPAPTPHPASGQPRATPAIAPRRRAGGRPAAELLPAAPHPYSYVLVNSRHMPASFHAASPLASASRLAAARRLAIQPIPSPPRRASWRRSAATRAVGGPSRGAWQRRRWTPLQACRR